MKKNIRFYLAPPLLNIKDRDTGHLKKIKFGSWMFFLFKILSKLKFVRGTKFDFFGKSHERKKERMLAEKSASTIENIISHLTKSNYNLCEDLINNALKIRGYGHIKERNIKLFESQWDSFLDKIKSKSLKKAS